jgi:hypothetical protein
MLNEQKKVHIKLTDSDSIALAVKDINNRINGCGFSFLEDSGGKFKSYAVDECKLNIPGNLIILASFDFSYYHDLEIVFYDVSQSNIDPEDTWWDHWTKDQIELSDKHLPDGFEFYFNIGTHKEDQFLVIAKGLSYHFGNMSYQQ